MPADITSNIEVKCMLVTAADTSHARSLQQLIRSFRKHHKHDPVMVVDLGMTPEDVKEVRSLMDDAMLLVQFPYDDYPDYFNIKKAAGEYAWKPCIIWEALRHLDKIPLIWADAGCRIDGPLDQIIDFTEKVGLYASLTCGGLRGWTDDRCLEYLGILENEEICKKAMRAATLVAFHPRNKPAVALCKEWATLAQIKECIAPEGSSKLQPNPHRQDQSVLTALLAMHGFHEQLPQEQCRWNWTAHCDCDGRPRNI